MDIAQRIQAKTDNGDTIIDFLIEVMTDDVRDDFKPCHKLQAARLLANYGCCHKSTGAARSPLADQAINFIVDNLPEPSLRNSGPGSSDETLFDAKLAKVIRESTDDGTTVCRFLINVMEGKLKAFTPQNRITAARELLSRGFGKHAPSRRSGEGRNPEKGEQVDSHPSTPTTQPTKSNKSPNHTNQSNVTPYSDTGSDIGEHQPTPSHTQNPSPQPTKSHQSPNQINHSSDNDEINEMIDAAKERSDRILAQQGVDPDNPPHKPDYSAFDAAMENSHKWFHEWKNSIDPEEYQAIIKQTAERFDAKIDLRIERRKQAAADRERREKEEAEREVQQAKARAEAKAKAEAEPEEPDPGPPPSREDHERWSPTPSIPTSFRLVNCGHPRCKLHDGPIYYPEDDRSSPYYNPGIPPSSSNIFHPRL